MAAQHAPTAVTLCVLLWARPGLEQELAAYEDEVLALLPDHDGSVLQRVRTVAGPDSTRPDGTDGDPPLEVHVLRFGSERALDAYLADDRRAALAEWRERAIARTEVLRVSPVG